MSGIFGYVGEKSAKDILLDGLNKLKHRGEDSCGISLKMGEDIISIKAVGGVDKLATTVISTDYVSNMGIAQCDKSIRCKPTRITSKPSSNNLFAVAMDGYIENFDELKKMTGNPFLISTDEDLILAMLCVLNKQRCFAAMKHIAELINGAPSFVFFSNNEDAIYCSAGRTPLIVASGEDGYYVTSEINSIVGLCSKYLVLEAGELARITKDKLVLCDKRLRKIKKPFTPVNFDIDDDDMLMVNSILYLPAVVKNSLATVCPSFKIDFENLKLGKRSVDKIKRIIITGEGSSFCSSCIASHFFEQMTDIPCIALVSSELICTKTIIDKETLLVSVSHSGENENTILATQRAMSFGARSIAVTGNTHSFLSRVCNDIIFTGCNLYPSRIYGFCSSYIALSMLCLYIGSKSGVVTDLYLNVTMKMAEMLAGKISSSVRNTVVLDSIANAIYGVGNVVVSGVGSDYSLAVGVADDLCRCADISAKPCCAGELVLTGTDNLKGKIVFCLLTNDENADISLRLFRRARSLGARIVIFTTESIAEGITGFENVVAFNDSLPLFNPLICVSGLNKLSEIIKDKKNDEKQQRVG